MYTSFKAAGKLALENRSYPDIFDNSWFSKMFLDIDASFTPYYWNLGGNVIIDVEMIKNCELKVNIQKFMDYENNNGEIFSTNEGITISCPTFDHFQKKNGKVFFLSEKDASVITEFIHSNRNLSVITSYS